VWRNINASQVIVKRGLIWKLGSGAKVHVRKQPWLRDDTSAFITTNITQGRANMRIAGVVKE
jgi:hypothetical protein